MRAYRSFVGWGIAGGVILAACLLYIFLPHGRRDRIRYEAINLKTTYNEWVKFSNGDWEAASKHTFSNASRQIVALSRGKREMGGKHFVFEMRSARLPDGMVLLVSEDGVVFSEVEGHITRIGTLVSSRQ